MTKPDKKIQGIDAIEFIGKIVDAVKFQHDHPCEKKKDGKDCADQDIPVSEFCDNCTKSWEKAAAIEGQTIQEALDKVDELREKKKIQQDLKTLSKQPCTNGNLTQECAEKGTPLENMCPRCKEFWTKGAALNGDTPEQAMIIAKGLHDQILKGSFDERYAN